MDVSENSGTPKSSILIGFSVINYPFWGTPIFGNIHIFLWGLSYPFSTGWGPLSVVFGAATLVGLPSFGLCVFFVNKKNGPVWWGVAKNF